MTQIDERPVLVTGGTGKTGRRVAARLAARGVAVRVAARSAEPGFEWADPDSWRPWLTGARAVYIAYAPDLAADGAPEIVSAFAAAARKAGVERLALLSGRGEPEAQRAEALLADGCVGAADWTVLRAGWFVQNFSESFLLPGVQAGEIGLPVDPDSAVGEPFIDVEDIADAAVAALCETGHAGRIYEMTGPRLLTLKEMIAETARAAGRPIRLTAIDPDAYRAALTAQGVPAETIELVIYLFGTILDGRNARVCDGVRQALGRPARDVSLYLEETAASGLWRRAA
ncbi:MAG: NAD(P)H-binding protein [Marivibrio sp.]|uniref:NAD(P)H-binding protein n=1 Tax=Marivibrio sp. TaxID=2039719 RepID=UPI0032EEFF23